MKNTLSIIIISLLAINTLLLIGINYPVESKFIEGLSNPNDDEARVIVLEGEGEQLIDGTTYFEVPLGHGSVLQANLSVSVLEMETNKSYPWNPTVNVGLDTDIEWEFTGEGVGQMGFQEYFFDNSKKRTLSFTSPGGGTDQSSIIKLPKSASVTKANISMKGRFSQPDFTEYFTGTDDGLQGARDIILADINDDGWLDAVVTSEKMNKVIWYVNDRTPRDGEWQQIEITKTLSKAWSLDVADMDNDDDLDVVATSNDQLVNYGLYWYENVNTTDNLQPGNGSSWTAHKIDNATTQIDAPESVKAVDLDNDGDNDTVIGSNDNSNGGVYWFENKNGKATSWKKYIIYHETSGNQRVSDIEVMNINHTASGRLDVVAALYSQNDVAWFENDGNPTSTSGNWRRRDITTSYSNPWRIAVGDIDGDSKNDVVVGYHTSWGIYWYKAPTSITSYSTWSSNYVSWLRYQGDIEIAKINSDNYMDIVASSYQYDYIYYFRNYNGQGTNFWTYGIDYGFDGAMGLAVANIDKDTNGRDIAVNGYNSGEVRFYRNRGGTYPSWDICTIEEISLNGPQSLFCVDVDHDGANDTVALGYRGGDVVWLEAPEDPNNKSQQWIPHVIEDYLNGVWEVFVGDINGDDWDDVAVTGQNSNNIVWYECPTNPEKTFQHWNKTVVDSYLYNAWGIHIADIDDDGDNDIVASGRYADDLVWYQNLDSIGTSWTKFYIDNNINYPTGVWVEDMDGDSDLDVVVGSYYWSSGTGVRWYEAPADPTGTWTMHTIDSSSRYIYDVHVADIDNDGHPDVVAAPYYERYLRWYEAPDNARTGTWTIHNIWTSSSYNLYAFNIWVDDIGNDGYYDIVLTRNYEWAWPNPITTVWWFEAPDQPELDVSWTKYNVDSVISEPYGVFIADINNDKIQDILAAEFGGNLVNWYRVDISYPENVELSVGPTTVFSVPGKLDINLKHSQDFATAINNYLESYTDPPIRDDYGNEFIELRIKTETTTEGRVTLEDIDITYEWTAAITENPLGDLAWEITDLIPKANGGTQRIYVSFSSETPCKVKFSDLYIVYNGAPDLVPLPVRSVDEDSFNGKLYYLPDFFSDDYQAPTELIYELESWTNSEYIDMRIQGQYWLNVSCVRTPNSNWYGTSEVVVSAIDIENIKTYSNEFNVIIQPVNDLPYVSEKIPDLKILTNTKNTQIDLDREKKPFFKDVDNEVLYYGFKVDDEFKDNISVNLSTENVLEITALGEPTKNITITVYCDDKIISKSKLDEITVYQQFQVETMALIDEEALKKPRWKNIEDCIMVEDHPGLNNWIYLPNFVEDYDDDPEELEYYIVSMTNNGLLEVIIDSFNYIDIFPNLNFDGTSEIVLKATDDDENYGLGGFNIKMIPSNDPPIIEFIQPQADSVVSKNVLITGTAFDLEDDDVDVQLKLGPNKPNNPWINVENIDNSWSYIFDTTEYTERTKVQVTARGFDSKLYSDNVSIEVIVDNTLKDTDRDGYSDGKDVFPFDPDEWVDTDGDLVGDNADAFDDDPTQWSDQDGDGHGDNRRGKNFDQFPLDPTQYRDKDGDGYGDNPNGNNPDLYPTDPDKHSDDDEEVEKGLLARLGPLFPVWMFVAILVIIDVYVITYLYMVRTGKMEKRRAAKREKQKQREQAKEEKKKQKEKKKGKGKHEDMEMKPFKPTTIPATPVVIYSQQGDFGFGTQRMAGMVPAPIPGTASTPPMPGYLYPTSATEQPEPKDVKKLSKKDLKRTVRTKRGLYAGHPGTMPIRGTPYIPVLSQGYQPTSQLGYRPRLPPPRNV